MSKTTIVCDFDFVENEMKTFDENGVGKPDSRLKISLHENLKI